MANNEIQEKFKLYLELNKEIALFRKKQADQKKTLQKLEDEIKEYMKENQMDSISLNEGEILLYDRKISQSFKKETIVAKLTERLKGNDELAESLAESIVTNKVFNIESKIRAKIKKIKE
jgi:pheromone shutdown protein TraB